jgi:DNA-binding transcriptional LysR family regulator
MHEWPDLTALELVVAVADHGSLSAGARAIGMAQPNASRSLARLERGLGLSLVVRSTAGSRLTPAGLLVVDWARQVLTAAGTLVEGAAGLAHSGEGGLAVSASQTVAEHLLPAWLARLRAAHPGVSVDVAVHNTAEVVADVLAGVSALGFVEGPHAPAGVHSRVVAIDELVLVVAADHPWAHRRDRVSAAELAGTPLLTREHGSGTRVMLDEALLSGVGRAVTPIQALGSNAAVRVAVQSGAGPAVLSRLAVAEGLRAGALLEVPLDLDLRRHLRAVWTGPRRLTGLAAALVDIAAAAATRG